MGWREAEVVQSRGELIGIRARVAEVLNRKRSLSIEMIRELHDKLGISAEVLFQPAWHHEAARRSNSLVGGGRVHQSVSFALRCHLVRLRLIWAYAPNSRRNYPPVAR